MKRFAFLFLSLFLFQACSNEETKVEERVSANEWATQIESLESSMDDIESSQEAKQKSEELYTQTLAFIEEFPTDPRNADFMFMAARAANGLRDYEASLKLLDTIKKRFQDYDKLIEVYFLYAFTLDEDLKDKPRAKDAYMEVINKFPGESLALQSEALLNQLYMTDEELIQMLKDKNQ